MADKTTKQQLHPGARWPFRLQAYGWLLLFLFIVFIIAFVVWAVVTAPSAAEEEQPTPVGEAETAQFVLLLVNVLKVGVAVTLGALLVFGEIYARMAYNRFFYELAKEGLKIERGIIWKKYALIPYERIQNVDIERGILARILGFSSVSVQTAGYAGGVQAWYGAMSAAPEGYIPAVDVRDAEKIRELLLKKMRKR